jgi:hypothetical protein
VRLDEVVLRSLEKEPEQRYQHASQFKTEVEAINLTPSSIASGIEAKELAQRKQHAESAGGAQRHSRFTRIGILGACLLVAAAGLVPIVHKTKPFWGMLDSFDGPGRFRVIGVEIDSPAFKGGLKYQDTILSIDRTIPRNGNEARRFFDDLGPGVPAYLKVARPKDPPAPMKPGETPFDYLSRPEVAEQLDLTVYGEDPPIATIYYYSYWYPVAGGLAIMLGLFILANPTLGSRWCGFVVLIVGFGLAVGFFCVCLYPPWLPQVQLHRYHNLNWGDKLHFQQPYVGLAASLALTLLGVLELRRAAQSAKNRNGS